MHSTDWFRAPSKQLELEIGVAGVRLLVFQGSNRTRASECRFQDSVARTAKEQAGPVQTPTFIYKVSKPSS